MGSYNLTKWVPKARLIQYQNLGWSVAKTSGHELEQVPIFKTMITRSTSDDYSELRNEPIYLVQRATIRRPLGANVGKTLSGAVAFDYMGAAEFEFGELPKSLRRIESAYSLYDLRISESITAKLNGKDLKLRVFGNFDTTEQWNAYNQQLVDAFSGRLRLKESLRTDVIMPQSNTGCVEVLLQDIDFWWDIENDVFFSFDKQFMTRLPDHLKQSFNSMDATGV